MLWPLVLLLLSGNGSFVTRMNVIIAFFFSKIFKTRSFIDWLGGGVRTALCPDNWQRKTQIKKYLPDSAVLRLRCDGLYLPLLYARPNVHLDTVGLGCHWFAMRLVRTMPGCEKSASTNEHSFKSVLCNSDIAESSFSCRWHQNKFTEKISVDAQFYLELYKRWLSAYENYVKAMVAILWERTAQVVCTLLL